MDIGQWKQWAEMNEEERDHFLNLIKHVMAKVSEPDEADWHDLEQMDAYRHAVQTCMGRSEEDHLEEDAFFEGDPEDRFYEHCDRGFRRGMTEDACARQWRCWAP